MKCRLLVFLLLVTIILSGCEEYEYSIDMRYDGDTVIRKIVCSENVTKEVRERLLKAYSKQIDANSYEGRFGEELPVGVGGYGRNVHISNSMGEAYIYIERFRGKDAPAIDVEKSLGTADRLTDMVIDWLEFELGREPGFDKLKAFCDVKLREDIKNLALYFWIGERINQSEVNDSWNRILLYFYERGYFTISDLSDIAISADGEWVVTFARDLICEKLGISKSNEKEKRLAFLESEESLQRSASRFLASLEKQKKSDQKSDGKGGESSGAAENMDAITEEIFLIYNIDFEEMLGIEIFGDPPSKVDVSLDCPRKPYETNGEWDAKAGQVRWSGKVEDDNVPFLCYSKVGEPDEGFQVKRFGRVVLADDRLVEYVFWYKGLDEKQREQWDEFLGSLKPGQHLSGMVKTFRFTGEPPQCDDSEKEDRLLSDIARDLILEGLKMNSDDKKKPGTKEELQMQRKVFEVYPIGKVVKKDGRTFIEIEKQYVAGLKGLEKHSYVDVVYWFDKNDTPMKRGILQVHPRADKKNPLTGVFATHSPVRPNLIAISRCDIISVKENVIELKDIDAFDGSPVVDLKGDFFRFYKR